MRVAIFDIIKISICAWKNIKENTFITYKSIIPYAKIILWGFRLKVRNVKSRFLK